MFINKIVKAVKKQVKNVHYPKVTITAPLKRGITLGPVMLIPRKLHGADRSAYIKHEETHWRQQRYAPWNAVTNIASNSAQWKQEKEAFTSEIRYYQSIGSKINYDYYVDYIFGRYKNIAPYGEIKAFIYQLRDTNPYKRKV